MVILMGFDWIQKVAEWDLMGFHDLMVVLIVIPLELWIDWRFH